MPLVIILKPVEQILLYVTTNASSATNSFHPFPYYLTLTCLCMRYLLRLDVGVCICLYGA